MAGWISSKLKVAENLLQQIDQQAAESLKQGDKKPSDELDFTVSPKSSSSVPLKDQLKKKESPKSIENFGQLGGESSGNKFVSHVIKNDRNGNQKRSSDSKSPSTINDTDWTELLSTPNQPVSQVSGVSSRRGLRKGGGGAVVNMKGDDSTMRRGRKPGGGNGGKAKAIVAGGHSGEHESRKSGFNPGVSGIGNGEKATGRLRLVGDSGNAANPGRDKEAGHESGDIGTGENLVVKDVSQSVESKPGAVDKTSENVPTLVLNNKKEGAFDDEYMGSTTKTTTTNHDEDGPEYVVGAHVGRGHEADSDSDSDSNSNSNSDSSSTSNSEVEREREEMIQRRRQILAAKAAAKAAETIKEQENVVARLEGEKQSLEKILEERAKQAEQEASKLQSTMIETMDAADLEKQKHNHTRMEVLARLAKLETTNADLAKSVANAQWNLEMEVNNVGELRRLVDSKELVHEELKRQIYNYHQTRTTLTSMMPSKGFELEREMLEGEYSFIAEKAALLQEKATKFEADINVILKETESPTEVEVELKRRLRQMTDHLIQKQAQVETLSSEKATLLFRIEAVSRLLDENKLRTNGEYTSGSSREDLEEGTLESASPKLRMLQHKIQSGKQHLGSIVRQLDIIFSAGSLFLARNPAAKLWSLVYLACLHLWVLYILFSHSQSTEDIISSSVVSLENINNNIGV